MEIRDEWEWDDGHGTGTTLLAEVCRDTSPLNGKVFDVKRNDGVDAQVQPGTRFAFRQIGERFEALYYGGRVRVGFMTGRLDGDQLEWRYSQVADDGRTYSGASTVTMYQRPDGRVCLEDQWQWSDGRGSGSCLMVERR